MLTNHEAITLISIHFKDASSLVNWYQDRLFEVWVRMPID